MKSELGQNNKNKQTYTAQQVADILCLIGHDKKQAKTLKRLRPGYKSPTFTHQELLFIRDLIFLKEGASIIAKVADEAMEGLGGMRLNAPNARRLKFFNGFLRTHTAAGAARYAGYSPKSAKQQGYRSLRVIQGMMRQG
jgi:hypothetical protein